MLHRLHPALHTWEQADRPGFNDLTVHAKPATDSWTILVEWPKTSRSYPHSPR